MRWVRLGLLLVLVAFAALAASSPIAITLAEGDRKIQNIRIAGR